MGENDPSKRGCHGASDTNDIFVLRNYINSKRLISIHLSVDGCGFFAEFQISCGLEFHVQFKTNDMLSYSCDLLLPLLFDQFL